MSSEKVDLRQVLQSVESLREEVGRLNRRVAEMETVLLDFSSSQTESASEAQRSDEELVLTISAAIAAYLGVKPHIRQIRLLGSASWAQSGRATIQASHSARPHHG